MKKTRLSITTIFIGITLISCGLDNKKTNEKKTVAEKVNSYLNKLEKTGFSGTILIDYKGEKLLSKGYGKSDVKNNILNQSNTILDIGSITKQFTAAGILKLEMLGKLSVNDDISKYFPNIPTDKSKITIHQLLTHSSGLVEGVGDDYETITEKEFINRVFQAPLMSPIGEKYHYSNVGYSLLSIIIEKVSGRTYEEFLNKNLFIPAGMKQTGYRIPKWKNENIAIGYSRKLAWGKPNEKKWDVSAPFLNLKGNGGILSSVEDMYKWHLALLGNQILDAKSKEKYYKPYIKEGENASSFYAYGWAIFPTPRKTNLITHNGGNGIFFADFWRYLEEQVTIIVLTNNSDSYSDLIASQIAAIILKDNHVSIMPNDIEQPSISNKLIQDFSTQVFTTIRDGDKNAWGDLIKTMGTKDFNNMVPLETHITFFKKFNKRLQGSEIVSILHEEGVVLVKVKTEKEEFNMVLNIVSGKSNKLEFEGIMLD